MKKVKEYREDPIWCEEELTSIEGYQHFLKIALSYADTVCLSFGGGYRDFLESDYSVLEGSVFDHEITNVSPVTKGPTVCLLYLRIDKTVTKWLSSLKNIFDFGVDAYDLDDLCLIKDGKLIFCSCTHEEFCYVNSELKNILWG